MGEVETVTTLNVALTKREDFPQLEKCCYFINLRLGLNVWLIVESTVWLLLFVSALYYEIIFIDAVDLLSFIDNSNEWYFYLIFGDELHYLDQQIRSK